MTFLIELRGVLNGNSTDFLGLIVNFMTWSMLLASYFWAPMCILTNIDPVYQLLRIHYPHLFEDNYVVVILTLVRFIVIQHMAHEGIRLFLTITIPLLTILKTFMDIVYFLSFRPLNRQTILLYNQLHFICIPPMIIDISKVFAGLLLGFGFVIIVSLNWIIIRGWKLVEIEIYIVCVFLNVALCSAVVLALPWACKLDEYSKKVIHEWKVNAHKQHDLKYWLRLIKAQWPVALHYGMTKFDKETKRRYFHNIVNYTANAVLLYRI